MRDTLLATRHLLSVTSAVYDRHLIGNKISLLWATSALWKTMFSDSSILVIPSQGYDLFALSTLKVNLLMNTDIWGQWTVSLRSRSVNCVLMVKVSELWPSGQGQWTVTFRSRSVNYVLKVSEPCPCRLQCCRNKCMHALHPFLGINIFHMGAICRLQLHLVIMSYPFTEFTFWTSMVNAPSWVGTSLFWYSGS